MGRTLTKSIQRYLLVDSRKLADMATEDIGSFLELASGKTQYLQGDYTILKIWYRHVSARAPNPLRSDMAKVTGDYTTLYR